MPDRQDDLNPGSDLAPFADALKRLAPQPAHLSRDALLFEAGKAAAAGRLAPWVWPSATGTFAALSVVLLAFLVSPDDPGRPADPQVVYVYPEPAHPQPDADSGSSPAPAVKKAKTGEEFTETARLLKQRRDVLRWGVDMLPEPKPAARGPSTDVMALKHWLNLPPDTYAVPPTMPRKPAWKDEDDQ